MKISDFALAQHILKDICKKERIPFVDIQVSFDREGGGIQVLDSKNICHTLYKIISIYINKSKDILEKEILIDLNEREEFLTNLATSLRAIEYSPNVFSSDIDQLSLQSLYQRPLVWILMKDIICPLYDVDLNNIRLVTGKNPQVDIVKYYKEGEIDLGDVENYPFIFINEVDNKPVLNALLLIEVLKAHDLDPMKILVEMLETNIFDKLKGALTLAFNDDLNKKKVFLHTLMNVLRIETSSRIITAQFMPSEGQNQWWFLGMIEGMLESVRGFDWSTTKQLEPDVEKFWSQVELLKQKKHGQNVTFNELLELKRRDIGIDTDTMSPLQKLLSSDRVW